MALLAWVSLMDGVPRFYIAANPHTTGRVVEKSEKMSLGRDFLKELRDSCG
jgi:hypothetical protein